MMIVLQYFFLGRSQLSDGWLRSGLRSMRRSWSRQRHGSNTRRGSFRRCEEAILNKLLITCKNILPHHLLFVLGLLSLPPLIISIPSKPQSSSDSIPPSSLLDLLIRPVIAHRAQRLLQLRSLSRSEEMDGRRVGGAVVHGAFGEAAGA